VGNAQYITFLFTSTVTFSAAEIGAEFGATPFTAAPFSPPARAVRLVNFFELPGPPFEAEIATTNRSACLGGSGFTRHYLRLTKNGTATHVRATPGGLSGGGCNFSVYLEPL
jgi:hypothetical protein